MRRSKPDPKPRLQIWARRGDLFFADADALRQLASAFPEEIIKARMGYGFHHLADALAGKGLNGYQAQMVEHGVIEPNRDNGPGFAAGISVTWR